MDNPNTKLYRNFEAKRQKTIYDFIITKQKTNSDDEYFYFEITNDGTIKRLKTPTDDQKKNAFIAIPKSNRYNPSKGHQINIDKKHCGYSESFSKSNSDIINTMNKNIVEGTKECDIDCSNITIAELYQSLFIKECLQNEELIEKIMNVLRRIFMKVKETLGDIEYNILVKAWIGGTQVDQGSTITGDKNDPLNYYPVAQKHRDWTEYKKKYPEVFKNVIVDTKPLEKWFLGDYIGANGNETYIGNHADHTLIPLAGSFLRWIQVKGGISQNMDNYIFGKKRGILEVVRGYRANVPKEWKDISLNNKQLGITNFNIDYLNPDKDLDIWDDFMHSGRQHCIVYPKTSIFQKTAQKKSEPEICSGSGSTDFWIYNPMLFEVALDEEEVKLLILAAYLTLGSDGGHSLLEVLSSATMSAIFWKFHMDYAIPDGIFKKHLIKSNYHNNLYKVTENINPIGKVNKKLKKRRFTKEQLIEEKIKLVLTNDTKFVKPKKVKKDKHGNPLKDKNGKEI